MTAGNLAGRARPAPHLRAALSLLAGGAKEVPLDKALDDAVAVEALAKIIEAARAHATRPDGTVDPHLEAAYVIDVMRKG